MDGDIVVLKVGMSQSCSAFILLRVTFLVNTALEPFITTVDSETVPVYPVAVSGSSVNGVAWTRKLAPNDTIISCKCLFPSG